MSAHLLRAGLLLLLVFCAGCGLVPAQAAAPNETPADANCSIKTRPPEAVKSRLGASDFYQYPGRAGKGYSGCVWTWIVNPDGALYAEGVLRLKRGELESYRLTEQPVPGSFVISECTYSGGKLINRAVQPSAVTGALGCPDAQTIESELGAPDAR
jgi:hypothetical protein